MGSTWKFSAAAAVAAIVLGVSMTLTQPAAAAARAGREAGANRANRPAAERTGGAAEFGVLLTEQGNVECANTAQGVKLTITTDDAKQVARLQEQVATRVNRIGQAVGRAGKTEGLAGMIQSGEVKVAAQNIDNGVVVTVDSTNAEMAGKLQVELPKLIEVRKAVQTAVEQAREFDRLVSSGKVAFNVQQTATGVTVSLSSDDPNLAAEIKAKVPAYFDALKQRAQLMEKMGAAREGKAPAPRKREKPAQTE